MTTRSNLFAAFTLLLVCGGCPTSDPYIEGPPQVRIVTSMGEFVIELVPDEAPVTVENFRRYVDEGFYAGTIFHRVIPGFVVQGGGYQPGLVVKQAHEPIVTESGNGLTNARGTVGMARTEELNSATSQFYVNVADNAALDTTFTSPGYTVFGRVSAGMEVIDQIAAVQTSTQGELSDVPVSDVTILSATFELGVRVVNPEWEQYGDEVRYDLLTALREAFLDAAGTVISGQ